MTVQEEITTTVDQLLRVIAMKNVVGEPIEMGDRVIITVTRVGLGFGAGTGEGKGEKGESGIGGGAGGAVGVTPIAAILIQKNVPGTEGVKILPLAPPSALGRAIGDVASAVVERMADKRSTAKETEKGPKK